MRRVLTGIVALVACIVLASCGSSSNTKATSTATAATEASEATEANEVDCDAFMQQLADSCFAVIAFEEDGVTPLHIQDDAGNDLGEVDQQWAASYCECYAQLAFQTFGCTTVLEHEDLDDDTYASTYAPIVSACSANDDANSPSEGNAATTDTPAAVTAPTEVDPQDADGE